MKKLALTLAIVLGMTLGVSAQEGGLFGKGATRDTENTYSTRGGFIDLPGAHGETTDQGAPLGSGIAVLVGLGAAYAMTKKNKK